MAGITMPPLVLEKQRAVISGILDEFRGSAEYPDAQTRARRY